MSDVPVGPPVFRLARAGLSDPISAVVRQHIMLNDEEAFEGLQAEFFKMKVHHELSAMEPMLTWCVLFRKVPVVNVVRAVLAACTGFNNRSTPNFVRLVRYCAKVSLRFRLRAERRDVVRLRKGLQRRLTRAAADNLDVLDPADCELLFAAFEGVLDADAEAAAR